jgi:elongation factor G
VHVVNGRKDISISEAHAGDLVALPKLKFTGTNDTLAWPGARAPLPRSFPESGDGAGRGAQDSGDDDKIGVGLHRLAEEDPTLRVERNTETKELILAGMGDIHLDVAVTRMKKRSNVDVVLSTPKVPYKETITAARGRPLQAQEAVGRARPVRRGLSAGGADAGGETEWFEDALVGTNVPRNFLPAIEKGLLEGMARGVLAGAPVTNTKVTIYDGSHHEVDSSEIAFKIAAGRAFTDGMTQGQAGAAGAHHEHEDHASRTGSWAM